MSSVKSHKAQFSAWVLTCIVYATLSDRHEMTTLSGSTVIEGIAITTTDNTAYGMMRHGERLEDEYEMVNSQRVTERVAIATTANTAYGVTKREEDEYEVIGPPGGPLQIPLPTIPSPVAAPIPGIMKQEDMYELICEDK